MNPELGFTDDKMKVKAYITILNLIGEEERIELDGNLYEKAEEIEKDNLYGSIEEFYESIGKKDQDTEEIIE